MINGFAMGFSGLLLLLGNSLMCSCMGLLLLRLLFLVLLGLSFFVLLLGALGVVELLRLCVELKLGLSSLCRLLLLFL